MKISLALLQQFVDVPYKEIQKLRRISDEIGLEVEEVEEEMGEIFFKIETLAHRGDHLCALGIAREFSAHFLTPLHHVPVLEKWDPKPFPIDVFVETENCLRYALVHFTLPNKIDLSKSRYLENIDLPIVSLLNYVTAELGQPMHAFDADTIEGNIRVVLSEKEEEIEALDGKSYLVPPHSILIRDSKKTVAVAGIIGCANSMVSDQTKSVLIESATFDPVSIRKSAQKMGLSTDASYIFERGSDREQVLFALKRLLALLPPVETALFYDAGKEREKRVIALDLKNLCSYLHLPQLKKEDLEERLTLLGYTLEWTEADRCLVTIPSWREWNVHTSEAIIEDFAKSYGLNRISLDLPALSYEIPPLSTKEEIEKRIETSLLGHGFFEVMTKSYYSHEALSLLEGLYPDVGVRHVSMKNSLEREYSFLKNTNVIHLAKLARENLKRDIVSFKVYECARLYDRTPLESPYNYEWDAITMAVAGRWLESEWKKPETCEEKLFLLKGVLESFFASLGGQLTVKKSEHPYLHPNSQAILLFNGKPCGHFGLVHPKISEWIEIEMLYVELSHLQICQEKEPPQLHEYPPIKRDLTFKVPTGMLADELIEKIGSRADLQKMCIVDSFQKKDEDFRRVSYRLVFQSSTRTLLNEEVDQSIHDILLEMKREHGLELADAKSIA